jgi:hypothetical protein
MRPPSGNFERLKFILRGDDIGVVVLNCWVSVQGTGARDPQHKEKKFREQGLLEIFAINPDQQIYYKDTESTKVGMNLGSAWGRRSL